MPPMLNLGRLRARDCQGVSRRSMLQMGACSALGLALPHWFAAEARSAQKTPPVKSVLLLWLWGGPSHHEMWDPKPNAQSKIRGSYRFAAGAAVRQRCDATTYLRRDTYILDSAGACARSPGICRGPATRRCPRRCREWWATGFERVGGGRCRGGRRGSSRGKGGR